MNKGRVRDSILSNQRYVYHIDHLRVSDKRARTDRAVRVSELHLYGDLVESFRHHRLYLKDGATSYPVSASGSAIWQVAQAIGYERKYIEGCKRQSERRIA